MNVSRGNRTLIVGAAALDWRALPDRLDGWDRERQKTRIR